MTNILYRTDSALGTIIDRLRQNKKRETASGVILYTILFILYFCVSILPTLLATRTLLGDDSISQYYPFLIEFKRSLTSLFESITNGSPELNMINFNYSYGEDIVTNIFPDFLPFLPYYIFSVFVPYESLDIFYGIWTVLLLYLSGISFLYLCHHFRYDMIISGLFAPFCVFSGQTFFTTLFNQQFFIMNLTIPLMIVGIDKIINRKSPLLFIFAVFWTNFGSFIFLIYTIPFIVLFAILRVRFVYKENYFRNLGICFIHGLGAFILGALLSSLTMLPCLYEFIIGSRGGADNIDLFSLLIPDLNNLEATLVPYTLDNETSIAAACIPFIIFLFTDLKSKAELKCYSLVMMLLIALPVIRYGLNGFQYSIVRWGAIPSILLCIVCIAAYSDLRKIDKKQGLIFIISSLIYLLLITMKFDTAAVIFLITESIITAVPLFRNTAIKAAKKLGALKSNEALFHRIKLISVVLISIVMLLSLVYCLVFGKNYLPNFIFSILFISLAAFLYYKTGRIKSIISILVSLSVILCSVNALTLTLNPGFKVGSLDDIHLAKVTDIPETNVNDPGFGRIYTMDYESYAYTYITDETESDDTTEDTENNEAEENDNDKFNSLIREDKFLTLSLRYDIPDIYVFKSVINKDIINLENRIGLDFKAVPSSVEHMGFSAFEPLYSLFGVEYMIFGQTCDCYKNIHYLKPLEKDDESSRLVYVNDRAFPVGVTYSNITSKDRFDSFDSVSLPFAMMNEIYLEGYNGPLSGKSDNQYAFLCDTEWNRNYRGTVSYGMDCYDNDITIKNDVSGNFLFISFTDVDCKGLSQLYEIDCNIKIDNKKQVQAQIHNNASTWPWKYSNDHYTIPLGYFEEDVDKISFINPFNFSGCYVSAVPASVYDSAYEDVTKEILTDVETAANTLTGKITVSEDKILSINMIYNDGWKAYVDGELTPIYKANGVFLGIPLKAGTHDIRLEYTTPFLKEGLIVSLISLAVLIAFIIISKKVRKKDIASLQEPINE